MLNTLLLSDHIDKRVHAVDQQFVPKIKVIESCWIERIIIFVENWSFIVLFYRTYHFFIQFNLLLCKSIAQLCLHQQYPFISLDINYTKLLYIKFQWEFLGGVLLWGIQLLEKNRYSNEMSNCNVCIGTYSTRFDIEEYKKEYYIIIKFNKEIWLPGHFCNVLSVRIERKRVRAFLILMVLWKGFNNIIIKSVSKQQWAKKSFFFPWVVSIAHLATRFDANCLWIIIFCVA